jgi:hypothetical protein
VASILGNGLTALVCTRTVLAWHAVMCAGGLAPSSHAHVSTPAGGWHHVWASVRQSRYTQQHAFTLTAADAATSHQLALMDNKEMTS